MTRPQGKLQFIPQGTNDIEQVAEENTKKNKEKKKKEIKGKEKEQKF